MNKKKTRQIWQ